MLISHQPRCARFAAWTTAVLRGRAGIDHALDALSGPQEHVSVLGLPDASAPASLTSALGQLRALGVTGLSYAPALPGNVSGLPGPPDFNARAVASGGAAIAVDGQTLALRPSVTQSGSADDSDSSVQWQTEAVTRFGLTPTETVAEAERHLLEELNGALDELSRLDVPQWREEALDLLTQWSEGKSYELPPGLPDRARQLIHRTERMSETLTLAIFDDGATVSNSEAVRRRHALLTLHRTAIAAGATAWNAGLVPTSRVA